MAVPPELDPSLGRPQWMRWAACRGMGADLFICPPNTPAVAGRAVCARCPVRTDCLEFALADPDIQGLWGGTSTRERVQLRLARGARPRRPESARRGDRLARSAIAPA